MAVGEAWRAKQDELKAERIRRDQYRRQVQATIGCEDCFMSKDELAGEQARKKAECMARNPEWFA